MNYDKELTEILDSMPKIFSGKQFANACVEAELDRYIIKKGISTSFLHLNADIIPGTRTWCKRDAVNVEVYFSDSTKEEECIQYLKEKGYRVMKLNWQEI